LLPAQLHAAGGGRFGRNYAGTLPRSWRFFFACDVWRKRALDQTRFKSSGIMACYSGRRAYRVRVQNVHRGAERVQEGEAGVSLVSENRGLGSGGEGGATATLGMPHSTREGVRAQELHRGSHVRLRHHTGGPVSGTSSKAPRCRIGVHRSPGNAQPGKWWLP
jgi:hypothetical protein